MTRAVNRYGVPVGSSLDRDTWPLHIRARLCDNPQGFHIASDAARTVAANGGIWQTRCVCCHQRIYLDRTAGNWSVAAVSTCSECGALVPTEDEINISGLCQRCLNGPLS